MRLSFEVPHSGPLDWRALEGFSPFLYRRAADRDEAFLGVGARAWFEHPTAGRSGGAFGGLTHFLEQAGERAYGHLAYDLKNEVEPLTTRHPDRIGFPLAHWFVPRFEFELHEGRVHLRVHPEDEAAGRRLMRALTAPQAPPVPTAPPGPWRLRTDRATYLAQVRRILAHIQRGDVYELNYCVERVLEGAAFDPFDAFARMHAHLDPPHAAFYRLGPLSVLCASPERFLRCAHGRVMAQPMKGTRPRSSDPGRDRALAEELARDGKERAENIMAVDVMRNDLSRVARSRSVQVDELCAVRSYPAVHQMISTVTAELRAGLHPMEAVRAAWPMASMTGAPKVSAMRLIDDVEDQRRGLFSGSLGWCAPDGSCDLNVVIRSIVYDAERDRASLITGSALTARCTPEKEWEECALKARSVLNAIGHAG